MTIASPSSYFDTSGWDPRDVVSGGSRMIPVDTAAGTRHWPDAGRDDAPRIVAELVAQGEQVYGVRVLRSSLEDAYLQAVEGA